ncbi:hypothetical protein TNCV_2948621 [Trichonephila clavipes]|nr:hypothetical protein TNCV_2948621 [Trichonephila clavipes]
MTRHQKTFMCYSIANVIGLTRSLNASDSKHLTAVAPPAEEYSPQFVLDDNQRTKQHFARMVWRGMDRFGALAPRASSVQKCPISKSITMMEHPPYSPDLAP